MNNEEFLSEIDTLFSDQEFSVTQLVRKMYNYKPKSNTPEYRLVTARLRVLEKKKMIFSRKVGNLKRYRLHEKIPSLEENEKGDSEIRPEDYVTIREMVLEGFRTGRIPLYAMTNKEKLLVNYVKDNIAKLIDKIQVPYEKVTVKKTPTYIEIIPSP